MAIVERIEDIPKMYYVDAGTYLEGQLLKEGTGATRVALISAKGDTAIAVVDQTVFAHKSTTAKTYTAGEGIMAYPLGCKAVVLVSSEITVTYNPGAAIYLADTVDGDVNATAATSRPIGHYPRWLAARVTVAAHEKVPCYLDVEPGAATV